MPLLTQERTNWKYITIVVILAVVVGGGIREWQYLQSIEEEFRITQREAEKEETTPSETEKKSPEEMVSQYEIFSREVAYRDIWYRSRLPVRTLFVPEKTKINRIEAYLEALNFDPSNQRNVGIAIGPEIPSDCQGEYYLELNPKETASRSFSLDKELFQSGNNQITAWLSTEAEWGGGESWVSLKLEIYHQGEAPKLSDRVNILRGPIDPIECTPKGI